MDYITPDKFLYNMRLSAQIEWLLTMDLFYTVRLDNGATLIASAAGDMELRNGAFSDGIFISIPAKYAYVTGSSVTTINRARRLP